VFQQAVTESTRKTDRRVAIALGFSLLLASLWAVLGLSTPSASGVAATVIGETAKTPKPSCPTPKKESDPNFQAPPYKQCQGVGELTGLQVRAAGKTNPYKVPADGRIVAWQIDLARPSEEETAFFEDAPAGGPSVEEGVGWGEPSARLSVLKKKKQQRFKLVKQTRKVALDSRLGSDPIFTLGKPLRVKAGLFVAITTGNWFPALAHDEPVTSADGDQWLASRGAEHCGFAPAGASDEQRIAALQDALERSKPHQKKGTVRPYKCRYTASRLLYRAFMIPSGG
jgi:hypothetical protein